MKKQTFGNIIVSTSSGDKMGRFVLKSFPSILNTGGKLADICISLAFFVMANSNTSSINISLLRSYLLFKNTIFEPFVNR